MGDKFFGVCGSPHLIFFFRLFRSTHACSPPLTGLTSQHSVKAKMDSFDDMDDVLESLPPPFDDQDMDYPNKVLSHHVRGTVGCLVAY